MITPHGLQSLDVLVLKNRICGQRSYSNQAIFTTGYYSHYPQTTMRITLFPPLGFDFYNQLMIYVQILKLPLLQQQLHADYAGWDESVPKDILNGEFIACNRNLGRHKLRFRDVCKWDMKQLNTDLIKRGRIRYGPLQVEKLVVSLFKSWQKNIITA